MIIGYARVSTSEQETNLQIDALENANCDRIFQEKVSGKSKERPQLARMFDVLRENDTVVVYRLDRLGRSLKDLIELLEIFRNRKIKFRSLTENIDTTTAMGQLVFHLIASIAEFERNLMIERTKAGLAAARARGRKGGRRPAMSPADIRKAKAMLNDPLITKSEVAAHFNVSRPTLNKAIEILNEDINTTDTN